MLYQNLTFSKPSDRPFIFTDFVSTIDGKIFVKKDGYWPIGSKTDFEVFTFLRAHADAIVDGTGTAMKFGKDAIKTFNSDSFKATRKQLGKNELVDYIILTNNPEDLKDLSENEFGYSPTILSSDISKFLDYVKEKNYSTVFLNGGATLLGSFLKEKLIDELFLTIAPRIFGNDHESVLTLVEGQLLEPNEIQAELISVQKVENEVFLRYKIIY